MLFARMYLLSCLKISEKLLFSPSDGSLICKALKPGSENRIRFCPPPKSKVEKTDLKIQENKKQPRDIAGR